MAVSRFGEIPSLLRRWTVAGSVAALLATAGTPQLASAGTPCDGYEPSCGAGLCDCGPCGPAYKQMPVYRALDAVAGGIEHLFGLDKCNRCGCNSGCDAMGCQSGACATSMPVPQPMPMVIDHAEPAVPQLPVPATPNRSVPRTVSPRTAPPKAAPTRPRLPSVPDLEPSPPAPRAVEPRAVEPALPSAGDPQLPGTPPSLDTPQMTPPRLVPSPTAPQPLPSEKPGEKPGSEGSIFDALDNLNDPLNEGANRARRPYGAVRPTGMRTSVSPRGDRAYRPVYPGPRTAQPVHRSAQPLHRSTPPLHRSTPPLHRSTQPSRTSRHTPPQAIGSGLRPATTVEPLRPVSHSEPVELQPLRGQRVLAPYRPSRTR